MRRKYRLRTVFLTVGLVCLMVVGLMSLLLSLLGYGKTPAVTPEDVTLELPYLPGDFRNEDSGWKSYTYQGAGGSAWG